PRGPTALRAPKGKRPPPNPHKRAIGAGPTSHPSVPDRRSEEDADRPDDRSPVKNPPAGGLGRGGIPGRLGDGLRQLFGRRVFFFGRVLLRLALLPLAVLRRLRWTAADRRCAERQTILQRHRALMVLGDDLAGVGQVVLDVRLGGRL